LNVKARLLAVAAFAAFLLSALARAADVHPPGSQWGGETFAPTSAPPAKDRADAEAAPFNAVPITPAALETRIGQLLAVSPVPRLQLRRQAQEQRAQVKSVEPLLTWFDAAMPLLTAIRNGGQEEVAQPWIRKGDLRFRIVYHKALGVTKGEGRGYRVRYMKNGSVESSYVPAIVPPALRRESPVFLHGMTVDYTVEVEWLGKQAKRLEVFSREEELDGRKLTALDRIGSLDAAPGQTRSVEGKTPLLGSGARAVNFERTHLIIAAAGVAAGVPIEVLADEPQAGFIDPPNL
jgi:hypothetical protein